MKTKFMQMVFIVASLVVLAACAPRNVGVLARHDVERKVKTLYVWDADGHTDLALLRGLKAEAASQLARAGYIVSSDPNATEAYVKVTVDDAAKGGDGFIKARLYIVSALDPAIIYDKTCDVGSDSDDYPLARFTGCALSDFLGGPADTNGKD